MALPRILFVTCLTPSSQYQATMAHMRVILERYANSFLWFSLRHPNPSSERLYDIPYTYADILRRPSRPSWLRQYLNLGPWAMYLGHKIAAFGRTQHAQVVLADLAFEAVVAGRTAARLLGIPLLVSVHDDPVARIKNKGYPSWVKRAFEANVVKTMRSALCCGVISSYMGEIYEERYGVKTIVLYVGVEPDECLPPPALDRQKRPLIIGSVGSVVSEANWYLLIKAVRLFNQKHGAGSATILHIGILPEALKAPEVEATGWSSGEVFIGHLARIDVCFLNLWFEPEYAETRRMSFPTKVSSYIQSQRPMLAFGPPDSSVVRFVEEHGCGEVCTTPDPAALAERLSYLLFEPGIYERAVQATGKLKMLFSRQRFYESFERFISMACK